MKSRIFFGSKRRGTVVPLALAAFASLSLMISTSSSSEASSSEGTWKATFFLGLGRGPRPAVAFVFSRVGPDEEFGAAEELVETPEAIEMPTVLWHVARCTGVEDFARATEDFGEGAEDFGGAGAA